MRMTRSGGIMVAMVVAACILAGAGCGGAAATCGTENLPCCVGDAAGDGGPACANGLVCGGASPGVCVATAAARAGLFNYDDGSGSGSVSAPTCSDVGATCCTGRTGDYCVGSAYGFPLVCYQGTCWISVGPPPVPGYTPITMPAK